MLLVDTNVLVYAVGDDHPLRSPARGLLGRVAGGDVAATTTIDVLQEFAHVRARRRSVADATELARHYLALFTPLITPDEADLDVGLRLFEQVEALGPFDAVLAAIALNRDHISAIATADRAFTDVSGLTVQLLEP